MYNTKKKNKHFDKGQQTNLQWFGYIWTTEKFPAFCIFSCPEYRALFGWTFCNMALVKHVHHSCILCLDQCFSNFFIPSPLFTVDTSFSPPKQSDTYPPKQSSKPQNWKTKHCKSVEFLSILECKPPAQMQSPHTQTQSALIENFWRQFCSQAW